MYPSQRSMLGTFLDPFADKLLVATLFATLTIVNFIPLWLTGLIIIRDVLLVVGSLIVRYKSLPGPKTIPRYFDASLATVEIKPTMISKVNTGFQLTLVALTLGAPVFDYVDHPLLQGLWFLTALTTASSGLNYIWNKNVIKFVDKVKS